MAALLRSRLSMTQTIDIILPKPHPAQRAILQGARRFNVLTCGRRFGKDILLDRRAIKKAIHKQPVAWFAPTYRMLQDNWRDIRNIVAPIIARASEQEKRIELMTGGLIDFWSLDNPDGPRGRKYAHAAINEAAMVRGLGDAWNMVIRPTLADLQGGADFGSTPRGLNDFYQLWQGAEDKADWSRHHYTTYDNPHIAPEEIEALKLALPERVFRQEILAEFVEDGAYFQGVTEVATITEPDDPANHAGHYLVMGVDWALSQDFSVFTVACRDCAKVVDWWRGNQLDFTYQRERLVDMATRWDASVLPERNSIGEPNIEMLVERVRVMGGPDGRAGFSTTATTKPALIQRLASGIEQRQIMIPVEYGDELRMYQVETSLSGHPKFSAPDGQHDDRVISLALAWWAISTTWYMS